ncbi:MAG: YbjN domain-containing protein [Alphaproteobacteria bacterium]|nr:YbjN domain-containing protein [Alphaproteobacteria bacterium]
MPDLDQIPEIFEDVSNPLDSIEDMLSGNEWAFSRLNDEELSVQVAGKRGQYNLTFIWQDEYSAMQFFCEFDQTIPAARLDMACRVLRRINESLWLGHFDISSRNSAPCFRHTSLFRGCTQTSGAEHIEDLVDIALAESERFNNVFTMLATATDLTDDQLTFALSDAAGEA